MSDKIELSMTLIESTPHSLPAVAILATDEGQGQIELARESYVPGAICADGILNSTHAAWENAIAASEDITRRLKSGAITMPDGSRFKADAHS